ncbi:MAG: hypothetical protein AVDCRST_MAG79-1766, partial [uncultured Thermoleophilia bacterium]
AAHDRPRAAPGRPRRARPARRDDLQRDPPAERRPDRRRLALRAGSGAVSRARGADRRRRLGRGVRDPVPAHRPVGRDPGPGPCPAGPGRAGRHRHRHLRGAAPRRVPRLAPPLRGRCRSRGRRVPPRRRPSLRSRPRHAGCRGGRARARHHARPADPLHGERAARRGPDRRPGTAGAERRAVRLRPGRAATGRGGPAPLRAAGDRARAPARLL